MKLQAEVFEAYRKHILEHPEENRKGALAAKEALEHSPLYWNGCVDKTVHIPKIFSEQTVEDFRRIAAVTCRIFEKVIRQYREQETYRKLFPFSKELEELILLPRPYEGFLPIARLDLFYREDTGEFRFCEINTDGTAAMLRDPELRKALISNPAHQAVIRRYTLQPFELFDSWVNTFLQLYRTWPKHREQPEVVIVDFLENATLRDFEEYARHFQDAGINCEICDIRKLEYRDGVLYSESGNRVDAVYRRAVTADLMDHYDEVTAFLDAVREDAVFFAGAFDTQILHTKWLFYVLHREETMAFLTEEEKRFVKAHVPLTVEFSDTYIALEEVQKNKDAYMIKPMDAYASKGIYAAGREYAQAEWEKLTGKLYGKGHICQEYCRQYLTDNIDFAWGDGVWHPFMNMVGLYVYNTQFTGVLMRMAEGENIIMAHENERTAPVFVVTGRKPEAEGSA